MNRVLSVLGVVFVIRRTERAKAAIDVVHGKFIRAELFYQL